MSNPKKHILFVDDEPLVLKGLQRMLRDMRHEWEMTFLESGAACLEFMAQHPVDVVVSDMRMPGMNGAQLLNLVMQRHPSTVRLILSGHADQELILKCVGSTHQYLSKPCDPQALRATVARVIDLEFSLHNEHLQRLMAQMDHLPSVPALYVEIVERLHDPEVSLEEVGNIIGRDLGMTAKILKLVNSAFFGLRRELASPTEAVTYLGLDTIKSLVLSLEAFSQFDAQRLGGFSLDALWSHSLRTAALAREIAKLERADKKLMDEAFVSGLLHDAGKAALAFNFPERYAEVMRQTGAHGGQGFEAEQQVFGAHHADAGGYLLGLWGLPMPVVEAILFHHHPASSHNPAFSPLTAVHAANALIRAAESPGAAPAWDLAYLDRLALGNRIEVWRETLRNGPLSEN